MILSKFTTAKRREAIAAPDMRPSAMMRRREAVLDTTAGERFSGSGYAAGMAGTVSEKEFKDSVDLQSEGDCADLKLWAKSTCRKQYYYWLMSVTDPPQRGSDRQQGDQYHTMTLDTLLLATKRERDGCAEIGSRQFKTSTRNAYARGRHIPERLAEFMTVGPCVTSGERERHVEDNAILEDLVPLDYLHVPKLRRRVLATSFGSRAR